MFKRILIANRGEIACRVIRTCRRLGVETVAVYSEADADAQHVRQADFAYLIGGPRPADSYLRGDVILEVAKRSGAEAVHPGYGFLSENTSFARACVDAGIVFIGPKPESIDAMGSKAAAKALMEKHAVPLVPGYHGEDQQTAHLAQRAAEIGFPLMIKAASGGGGKGMRIVRSAGEFADALASAQRESTSAFGDQRMILERYVEHPRHIEFQIFGDTHGNVIHLNERECSSQRRYQKVLEETSCVRLSSAQRAQMGEAAVAAARAVDYVGAGTVEFIVSADASGNPGEFFFMEMNTRLQVEHPVTEMTLGLDLVEWQLRVAGREKLPLLQDQVHAHGHAIEVRLYAEDPQQNFLPGSGKLQTLRLPETSAHVRIDSGVVEGDTVTVHYDPMIAKIIVHDATRDTALQRMREALAAVDVVGPKSNIAFLEALLRHPSILDATIDTGYLDRHLDEFLEPPEQGIASTDSRRLLAAAVAALLHDETAARNSADATDPSSPWASADAFRVGHPGKRLIALLHAGERIEIAAYGANGHYAITCGDAEIQVERARWMGDVLSASYDGVMQQQRIFIDADRMTVHDGQRREVFATAPAFAYTESATGAADSVVAPMPGRIVTVKAKVDMQVEEGDELLVMEAMKMELTLRAPRAGIVEKVNAVEGEFVDADVVLVKLAEAT